MSSREAPQLIAQLPCYCYCDRGFGHKSLHSCFVDDHAAQCAVCVDEALLAYNLQKRACRPSKYVNKSLRSTNRRAHREVSSVTQRTRDTA